MLSSPPQSGDQALEEAFAALNDAVNDEVEDTWNEPQTEAPRLAYAPPGLPGAPLSPYVQVEHLMRVAMSTRQHASFVALKAMLPVDQEIHQNEHGQWVRTVSQYVKGSRRIVNGVMEHEIEYVDRHVALSLAQAQKLAKPDYQIDFWNGFTWMRQGVKPEKDFSTILNNQARGDSTRSWVRASEAEQAVAQAITARHLSIQPPIPVTMTNDAPEVSPEASAAARRGPGRPRKVEE